VWLCSAQLVSFMNHLGLMYFELVILFLLQAYLLFEFIIRKLLSSHQSNLTMMLRVYLLLVVHIYASLALSRQALVENEFAAFKSKFGKTYETYDEEVMRFEIFQFNFNEISKQNKMMRSYSVGVTQFSDLTHQEFKDFYLGYKNPSNLHSLNKMMSEEPSCLLKISLNLWTGGKWEPSLM
jgi:hypothetical protein